MEYIVDIDKIKSYKIIFKIPIKNQNNKYLHYYKLLYSDENIHLKYLLIQLNFKNYLVNEEDKMYRIKINMDDPIFNNIKLLEHIILSTLNQHVEKDIKYTLYDHIINKELYYVYPNNQNLYLKISGVWENETHIGLVYKLYYKMSTEKLSNMIC